MGEKKIRSYEEYRKDRENGRKIMSINSFAKKINHIIEDTIKENELKGYSMRIMFECIAISQHIPFLESKLEDGEPNIYKTINNIVKAKARSIAEILYLENADDIVNVKINTHGKKDNRLWDVIVTIEERELKMECTVKYSRVKQFLEDKDVEKVNIENSDITYLGERYLNKQQYFTKTLKESLNALDIATQSLVKINNKL